MWNTPVDGAAGAKYVPLDTWISKRPTKVACRDGPIGYSDILPHYERAQTLCGLGPFVYGADAWQIEGRRPFGPARWIPGLECLSNSAPGDSYLDLSPIRS